MANEIIEMNASGETYIAGDYKHDMTFEDAISYLKSYEFGTIGHPDMDEINFIFLRPNGDLAFFESKNCSVELLGPSDMDYFAGHEWKADWYYLPGYEFDLLNAGIQLWHDIRDQEPINPEPVTKFS